ncbi:hypothetical protein CHUAL_000712 [Chamberlinius hualienensis]
MELHLLLKTMVALRFYFLFLLSWRGKEWGVADGEPVLGLHGWMDNCATFDRLAPLLPLNKLRFVTVDFPGHGQSSHFPPGSWYQWENYTLTVARIVDYFKWNKFSFLSHSMGANVSFFYAGCFPQQVKRFVSLDIPYPLDYGMNIYDYWAWLVFEAIGKEWGVADGEPVLGLHGWMDNCATFDRLAPLLPLNKLRFVTVDFPGHGQSSHFPPGSWYQWENYTLTVARIVDYFKWNKFSFLSHSMGAKVSFFYAGCFPQQVKRFVSLDIPYPNPVFLHSMITKRVLIIYLYILYLHFNNYEETMRCIIWMDYCYGVP